jgi:hypothetical protein
VMGWVVRRAWAFSTRTADSARWIGAFMAKNQVNDGRPTTYSRSRRTSSRENTVHLAHKQGFQIDAVALA